MRDSTRDVLASSRVRVRTFLARKIRAWTDDPMRIHPGDPRRRINEDPTSVSTIRLVQFDENDGDAITMGRYCAFHSGAAIMHGGNHHSDWVGVLNGRWDERGKLVGNDPRSPHSRGPVLIGNDVWVGYEALILSGVTIGDGAVVGARAVVSRDVRPFEIVAGNPARHLRWRFDEPTRAALLRIRWWDWPHDKVLQHIDEINSPDVAGFIARHDVPHR